MELQIQLLKIRHEKGITQAEACELSGICEKTIASWELGRTSPSHKNLELYLSIYDKKIIIK